MNPIILLNCNASSFRSQLQFMKYNSTFSKKKKNEIQFKKRKRKKKKRVKLTHSIEKLIMRSIISFGPCGG